LTWKINGESIDLEVSEEFCNKNCSSDKSKCEIEKGISTETVYNSILKQSLEK